VGLRHLSGDVKRILSEITHIDQNNYPETLGKTLIINAPTVFRAIWGIVKPMLDPRTQAKIEVCPSDYLPVLQKWIDTDSIPAYLGGRSAGSLIDDIGPWNDPENFEEAAIRRESSLASLSTLATAAYLSAEEDEATDEDVMSPMQQLPIIERVKTLEDQIPSLEAGMSRELGRHKPSAELGQGTLLSRVEALEHAVSRLVEAQDSIMVANKANVDGGGCSCCTLM